MSAFASTQDLCNTKNQASAFTSADQQTLPIFNPNVSVSYYPMPTTLMQPPLKPAFQKVNPQYSSQQLESTSETIKPFMLMPHVTPLPLFTTKEQESKNINMLPTTPVVYSTQLSSTTQELTNTITSAFSPQNSYSQYHHSTNIRGDSTNASSVQNSKEISNYFTHHQTQTNTSNVSSTIPMFSVKNFPQISPLAQPLGK